MESQSPHNHQQNVQSAHSPNGSHSPSPHQQKRKEIANVKVVGVFTNYVGTVFVDRKALSACGIHRPPMAGIHGNPNTGAISIVLS